MNTRSLFLAFALSVFVPACTQPAAEETSSDTDALQQPATLKGQTIVKGEIEKGGAITIAYDPASYDKSEYGVTKGLPFMGVKVLPDPLRSGPTKLKVGVKGDFPGSPRLVVTDTNFKVLAVSSGQPTAEGDDVATVALPDTNEALMVLVRDEIWVRPMEFEVSALPE